MKFEYDKSNNILKFEHWKGNWQAKPIYIILCKCGAPVKAFFAGRPPVSKDTMDSMGFGTAYSYGADYRLITHSQYGWGFWLKYQCAGCRREAHIGSDETTALANYIKSRLRISKGKITKSRARDLLDRIKRDPHAQRFFCINRDELSDRPDAALVVDSDTDYDAFVELLEELQITYSHEQHWTEGQREKPEHYELEHDILAAHGEECTCSLCME